MYWKEHCKVTYTFSLFGSRWKTEILLFLLKRGTVLSYGEFKEQITGISDHVLISKLKELENDRLLKRTVSQKMSLHVGYELTAKGYSLKRILMLMDQWGVNRLQSNDCFNPDATFYE